MIETLHNLKQTLNERIKNPFIGTFIIAWIAINWRPISYFILSDEKIVPKINFIDNNYINLNPNLFYPLIIAFIYAGILPYINFGFDYLVTWSNDHRNKLNTQNKIKELKHLNEISIQELENEKSKSDYRDRQSINLQIETLKQQSLDKDKQIEANRLSYESNIQEIRNQLENQISENSKLKDQSVATSLEQQQEKDNLISKNAELQKQFDELKISQINFESELNQNKNILNNFTQEYNEMKGDLIEFIVKSNVIYNDKKLNSLYDDNLLKNIAQKYLSKV